FGETLGVFDGVTLIQSSFSSGGNVGNLEVIARQGKNLHAFFRGDTQETLAWRQGIQIAGDAAGDPVLIQSSFGAEGNFELVYPSTLGGVAHRYRANDEDKYPWLDGGRFATELGDVDGVSLIQTTYTSDEDPEGNLEAIVRKGQNLHHFYRAYTGDTPNPFEWRRGAHFANDASGDPVLIQSSFGVKGTLPDPYAEGDENGYKAQNVTIRDLTIVKYANPAQTGAVGGFRPGLDWVIEGNTVAWNHGTGIKFRGAAVVHDNYTHHNGQYGISCGDGNTSQDRGGELPEWGWFGGYCGDGAVVAENRIIANGVEEMNIRSAWGAGGSKFSQTRNLRVLDNTVTDNNGPGLWSDFAYGGTLYEGNTIADNEHAGILIEITMGGAVVSGNEVWNNGHFQKAISANRGDNCDFDVAPCDEGDHAQIVISNSPDVDVVRNDVVVSEGHGHAISILQRDGRHVEEQDVKSLRSVVRHNTITVSGPGDGIYGLSGTGATTIPESSSFHANTYNVDNPCGNYWWWSGSTVLNTNSWNAAHPTEQSLDECT
ncbi:MAG: right-handed parallel beta-helix repeat-containing protein, partial [Actinomycetia bacterium]|nr:right-handed parallel beta-helix repeat-containing protein [Actinomycetes bacterium]